MNKITIIQINKSHSNFMTKQDELYDLLFNTSADISINSEANTGAEDDDQLLVRKENSHNLNSRKSKYFMISYWD